MKSPYKRINDIDLMHYEFSTILEEIKHGPETNNDLVGCQSTHFTSQPWPA